ncbi:MAG: glycosyltransferase [Anaerolineae bacterium]|nr:glycosyltransferase [Candidatus Roseilinea sp.]MDW8448421.1 glycosyltransferase [Anaerolineae bacterium]
MPTLVSIIIPTYNYGHGVAEAIDCALGQTYPHVEVIVVDDGSSDNTRNVLAKYGNRIKAIHKTNGGVSTARNVGFEVSQGEYLLFLDSDDLIPLDKLARLVSAMKSQPSWGMVYSAWQCVDETGQRILSEVRHRKQGRLLRDLLLRVVTMPPGCVLIRRACLQRVGLFDPQLSAAADIDLWIRVAHAGYAIGYVDEFLFQYRILGNSMSRNIDKMAQDDLRQLDKYFSRDDIPDNIRALEDRARASIYYNWALRCFHSERIEEGQQHIREAIRLCPSLSRDKGWLLNLLGGYANDAEVRTPERMLSTVMDNLPDEAVTLRSLRRAAFASYHIAAIFTAYENGRLADVLPHVMPSILGRPRILANRGFLAICLRALWRGIRCDWRVRRFDNSVSVGRTSGSA